MTPLKKPIVSLEQASRTYRMGSRPVHALDSVSLEVAPGEYVAITGPSGSGKSTLLHMLGLLDRPDAGSVRWRGLDVGGLTDRQLSAVRNEKIGFIFQAFNLLPDQTALKNTLLPLIYRRSEDGGLPPPSRRARAALERVGLGDRADHRPSELSGGEQQRVAIARALVKEPALILADEPTGNLDSASGDAIMSIFDTLAGQGIAVVLITHDESVAAHARRRITIRDGRIVEDSGAP